MYVTRSDENISLKKKNQFDISYSLHHLTVYSKLLQKSNNLPLENESFSSLKCVGREHSQNTNYIWEPVSIFRRQHRKNVRNIAVSLTKSTFGGIFFALNGMVTPT